jgi:hypothetical protein
MISILLQLRTAAMNCSDKVLTDHLRALADEMSGHLSDASWTPCGTNMMYVNGCFARASMALASALTGPPAPQGGAVTLTEIQKAA